MAAIVATTTARNYFGSMHDIPGQVGLLALDHKGALLSSSGDLASDEGHGVARLAYGMLQDTALLLRGSSTSTASTSTSTTTSTTSSDALRKVSVVYPDFTFVITLNSEAILVAKIRNNKPSADASASTSSST